MWRHPVLAVLACLCLMVLPGVSRSEASLSPAIASNSEPPGTLTADSNILHPGECTTLRWTTQDAEAVFLDDERVEANGSREVCPAQTTTYTLKVWLPSTGCPTACPLEMVTSVTIAVVTPSTYLPVVSVSRPCVPPLAGTVSILGQATVHGRSAQPGVPFRLSRVFWEYGPTALMTVTTGLDGAFCFASVPTLSNCHGLWYQVDYNYVAGMMPEDDYGQQWAQCYVAGCQAGTVYSVSAEIRELSDQAGCLDAAHRT